MSRPTIDAPLTRASEQIADELETKLDAGLTTNEAERRLAVEGPNALTQHRGPTWAQRFAFQFRSPLVLLLIAAVVISVLTWLLDDEGGWPVDAIVIAFIVIVNAVLGALQEHRADEAVQALSDMTARDARVIRDGRTVSVAVADLVSGDLVVLDEGAVVPADLRLVTSEGLRIGEAALTGESVAVAKSVATVPHDAALADRTCMTFAGTAVVAGHGTGVVTATGMRTEVGAIAEMLGTTEQLPTPLERELRRVSKMLGIVVIGIVIVVSIAVAWTSPIETTSDAIDVLILGVSLAVAAVPEGLPAVLSLVLAIGVGRMARRNAVVKRLALAETLGSATIICADKTGTLTQNRMQVRTVVVPGGHLTLPTDTREGDVENRVFCTLVGGAVASNLEVDTSTTPWTVRGDPTEAAFMTAAYELGFSADQLAAITRLGEVAFDSDRKRMSVLVSGFPTPAPAAILVKGAPDVLLGHCSHELTFHGRHALSEAARLRWGAEVEKLADQGMRTMLVATRDVERPVELSAADECDLTILGLVGLVDPARVEAAPAIAEAQRAGIEIVMLTGDHPRTGAAIAKDLGIANLDGTFRDPLVGSDLDHLTDEQLGDALRTHAVFARVTPAHKLRMVRALQAADHVVAMTGDGVNDAPALKAADIGTAMGQSGTEVAREAADMVLTDDNFGTIIDAIRGGRTIFHNVKSFLRYLLSSNVGEVLTIFLGVLFADLIGIAGDGVDIIAPVTAAQILWINVLTDTGPAFALGLDPTQSEVMNHPPRQLGARIIDAAMQRGIVIIGLTMAIASLVTFDAYRPGGLIDGDSTVIKARTMAFTVLVLTQLVNCFNARSDQTSVFVKRIDNPLLWVAVALSFGLQIAVVHLPVLQRGFGTTGLSLTDWMVAAAAAMSVLVVSECRKLGERTYGSR